VAKQAAEAAGKAADSPTALRRVTHQKFGPGTVTSSDGNKLTVQFDSAGEMRVVASGVERVMPGEAGFTPASEGEFG